MEKEAKRSKGINSAFPRIAFFGTPEFAVPSLARLVSAGAPVSVVVTQPDRPKGRGVRIAAPPVKIFAEEAGLPVFQPARVRAGNVIQELGSFHAECAIVVAYGQLLPRALLDVYPLGAINVHASILPRHRGAAPIQRSLLCGDRTTGVTIMLLDAGMDTGPVLSWKEIPVGEDDCFGTMHDRLARLGADLLCETVQKWKAGLIQPVPQKDAFATYAPPIRKEELRLDWRLPAQRVVNAIHAFDPVPGAYTALQGKRLKCFSGRLLSWQGKGGKAGEVVGRTETGLVVLGGDGIALSIGALQLEGQKRLPAPDFLRGHPIPPGTVLG